jgi:hypothetical protein
MTFDIFVTKVANIHGVIRDKKGPSRYGQTLFNVLQSVKPELAEELAGTKLDPSNKEGKDIKDETWEYIKSNW